MKTIALRIRNIAFYAQFATLISFFALLPLLDYLKLPRPGFPRWVDLHLAAFSFLGLVVLLLTLKSSEARIQKASFLLAGGAGTALLITLAVFSIMRWCGHTPGGDGGGITVPMILLCPLVFFFGAVSAIVCLIRGKIAEKKQAPAELPPSTSAPR